MDTQPPSSFAPLLRRLRRETGLTQEELAEQAGIAWRTVSDLERGVKLPRRDTVTLLVEALALIGERRTAFEAAAHRRAGPLAATPTNNASAWSPIIAFSAPLVGRAQELVMLDRHIAGLGPPVLLLAGQPGIGKSRLLQEVAANAQARGWCVLAAGCTRGADQQPFAPLLQALQRRLAGGSSADRRRDLCGCAWLIRLLPELPEDEIEPLPQWTLPPEQERRLMFDAVRRFLVNVAGSAGTLLLLDDLQWAGQDALALISALLQTLEAPLRVVGAYRDTEVGPEHPLNATIADLAERQLATEHILRPLARHEAAELFARLLGDRGRVEEARAAEVMQRAGGVPFFLISCVRELERADNGESLTPGVPWDLHRSIQRRVLVLPESARTVLAATAVIGRVTTLPLLTVVLERTEQEILEALDRACRAGLLEEVGDDAYGFVHDVIREVVEGDLGLGRRRLLHRQVAAALEQAPGTKSVEALAYHFLRVGERASAVPYLEQAGDLAEARYAHAAAAAYYQSLVECLEEQRNGPEVVRALEKLTDVFWILGWYGELLTLLGRAAEMLRSAGDLDGLGRVEAWIAYAHIVKGSGLAAMPRLEAVVDLLEAHGPSRGLVHGYSARVSLFTTNGQADRAVIQAEHALDMARAVGDHPLQVDAALNLGYALMYLDRADEALQVVKETVLIADGMNHPAGFERVLSQLAWLYEERGEYGPAREAAERALTLAEQLRVPDRITWNTVRLGVTAFLTGDWPRARMYLEQAEALARQMGILGGRAYAALQGDLGRLCIAQGRWDEATHHLEEILAAFAGTDERFLRLVAHGQLAERDVLAGNPDAAIARLGPLLDQPGVEERMVTQYILPVLAWAYVESGETDQAAVTVTSAVRRARAAACRLGLVHALRVQALVLAARECWAEAAGVLEEGLALARSMPYPHGEGRLLHVYGRLDHERGEPADARERLDTALAIFRRLGARKDIELVEREIAAL